MKVYYPAIPASDGTSMNPPENAQFTVHELSDTTFTSPLPLETLAGTNAAPLTTTAQGVLPDVYVISNNYSHVFKSGEWEFRRDSFDGAQLAVTLAKQDATDAAEDASRSREAAEDAAAMAKAPTQQAVTTALTTEGPAKVALEQAVAAGTSGLAMKPDNGGKPVGKGEMAFNVRDYGARGDGITDDQAAIQRAVIAARDSTDAKTVIFPPGSYYIKHVVQIYSDITLQGVGDARIVKIPGATATVCFGIKSEGRQGYGSGARNIVLRGLKFQGDFAKGRACGAIGANHGSNILVEWCVFEQCTQKGHIFDMGGCENVTIRNCIFRGANYPTEADSYNECIQADNSTRGGSSFIDDPGSYDGLASRNFYIQNNIFESLTVGGVTYPAPIPFGSHWAAEGMYHENLNFTGNTVTDPATDTASVYHGILHFIGARTVNIENNTFRNGKNAAITAIRTLPLSQSMYPADSDNADMPKHPLDTPMVCSDIRIVNNRFIGFKNEGTSESIIAISGSEKAPAFNVTIDDNTFLDCGVADFRNVGPNQIELLYVADIAVRGNSSDVSRRLLYFASVHGLKVQGNTIRKSSNGVAVNGTKATAVKVTGNEFDDYAGGFLVSECVGLEVTNNSFRNERAGSFTSINIGGASKRFIVTDNDILTTVASSKPVMIQQASAGGIVRSNILTGATTPVSVSADSTATVDGNLTT